MPDVGLGSVACTRTRGGWNARGPGSRWQRDVSRRCAADVARARPCASEETRTSPRWCAGTGSLVGTDTRRSDARDAPSPGSPDAAGPGRGRRTSTLRLAATPSWVTRWESYVIPLGLPGRRRHPQVSQAGNAGKPEIEFEYCRTGVRMEGVSRGSARITCSDVATPKAAVSPLPGAEAQPWPRGAKSPSGQPCWPSASTLPPFAVSPAAPLEAPFNPSVSG